MFDFVFELPFSSPVVALFFFLASFAAIVTPTITLRRSMSSVRCHFASRSSSRATLSMTPALRKTKSGAEPECRLAWLRNSSRCRASSRTSHRAAVAARPLRRSEEATRSAASASMSETWLWLCGEGEVEARGKGKLERERRSEEEVCDQAGKNISFLQFSIRFPPPYRHAVPSLGEPDRRRGTDAGAAARDEGAGHFIAERNSKKARKFSSSLARVRGSERNASPWSTLSEKAFSSLFLGRSRFLRQRQLSLSPS